MPINPLNGTDTFKTWFDKTNEVISAVNGITALGISGATGINVTFSGITAVISNTGIVSITAGSTGIGVSTTAGVSTIINTGVWTVNGSTGNVIVTGLSGDIVTSFNGRTGGVTGIVDIFAGSGLIKSGSQTFPILTNSGVLTFNGSTGNVFGVNSVNGLTGSLTVTGFTGISVSSNAKGITIFNTGVWSVNGSTGDVVLDLGAAASAVVTSFNGLTGAVSGVCGATSNTFTALQTFGEGVISSTDIRVNGISMGKGGGNVATNLAIGIDALGGNTGLGLYNTAIGSYVLSSQPLSGDSNVGVGYSSLENTTTGTSNTAVGHEALVFNTSGNFNTAIGRNALRNGALGNQNVAVGHEAILQHTTGNDNVGIGRRSFYNLTSYDNNVAVGSEAGRYVGTGTSALTGATGSIFIGYQARGSANSQQNEIVIGRNAVGLGSNTAVLGATLQQAATIYGQLNLPAGLTARGATFGSLVVTGITNNISGVRIGRGTAGSAASNVFVEPATSTSRAYESLKTGNINNIVFGAKNLPRSHFDHTASLNFTTILGSINLTGLTSDILDPNVSDHSYNTAVGNALGNHIVESNQNVFFGYSIFGEPTIGSPPQYYSNHTGNVYIGNFIGSISYAPYLSTGNVLLGNSLLTSLLNTNKLVNNIVIGSNSLPAGSNVENSIAIGSELGQRSVGNVFKSILIGTCAGVYFGSEDGEFQADFNDSILIGNNTRSGLNVNSQNEIVIGTDAVGSGSYTTTIGSDGQVSAHIWGVLNTPDGISASGLTVSGNIISVGAVSIGGDEGSNVLIGEAALASIQGGSENIAIGSSALESNTEGSENLAIGSSALRNNTVGDQNVGIGGSALFNGIQSNKVIALGSLAAYNLIDATGSIFIGSGSNPLNNNSGTNEIVIGTDAVGLGSNTAVLGATLQQSATIYGNLFLTTGGISTSGGATFGGNISAPNVVYSINNQSGNLTIAGLGGDLVTTVNGLSGNINIFGATGINVSAGGRGITLRNTGVWSVNGSTGDVTISASGLCGATTNVFTAIQSLVAGFTTSTDIRVNGISMGRGGGNRDQNLAIGINALVANSNGINNVAVGRSALQANTLGGSNVGIGINALTSNTFGSSNTAVGPSALTSNTSGSSNTAVGPDALLNNTSGSSNTVLGSAALAYNQTGSDNTAVGVDAGAYRGAEPSTLNSATGGIFIGRSARGSANGQINEIVIGTNALGLGSNTAVLGATLQQAATIYGRLDVPTGGLSAIQDALINGIRFGRGSTVSNRNIYIGGITGFTAGSQNVSIGINALGNLVVGERNIAIGGDAGAYWSEGTVPTITSATGSVFIGHNTRSFDNDSSVNEIVIGTNARGLGANNAVIGATLQSAATIYGQLNIPTGDLYVRGVSLSLGLGGNSRSGNVAIGQSPLPNNTTGQQNVAIGTSALNANQTGQDNVALGNNALYGNLRSQNIAIGSYAGVLYGPPGVETPATNVTGGVYLGYDSRPSADSVANEIVIGRNAVGLGSNSTVIGATLQQAATIYGRLNLPTGGLSANGGATFTGNIYAPNLVTAVNGLTGGITLFGATGISVTAGGKGITVFNTGVWSVNGQTGNVQITDIAGVITAFNGLTGGITLFGATGISVTAGGKGVTVFNTGVWSVNGQTGNVQITGLSGDSVISLEGVTGIVDLIGTTGINISGSASNKTITIQNTGVWSILGQTGPVTDVTSFVNGLTGGITLFGATGISVAAGGKGITLLNTGVWSFNGLTGAVTGVTTSVANIFTALQTFSAGISSSGITVNGSVVSSGITVNGNALVTGTLEVDTGLILPNGQNITGVVSLMNGLTGGITLFGGTGMNVLVAGKGITLVNTGVLSFNGSTGNIRGVGTLNGISGGVTLFGGTGIAITVSSAGITIGSTVTAVQASAVNTFTALQIFGSGISASNGITVSGRSTFIDGINATAGSTVGNIRIVGANISTTGTTAGIFTNSNTTIQIGGAGYTLILGSTLTNSETKNRSWINRSENSYFTGTGASIMYPYGLFKETFYKSFTLSGEEGGGQGSTLFNLLRLDKRAYSTVDATVRITRGTEGGAPTSQQITKLNFTNISDADTLPSAGIEDYYFNYQINSEFAVGIKSSYFDQNPSGYTFALIGVTWDTSSANDTIVTLEIPIPKAYQYDSKYIVHTEISGTRLGFNDSGGAGGGRGGGGAPGSPPPCCTSENPCAGLCLE